MMAKALWYLIKHPNGEPRKARRPIRSRSVKRAKEEREYNARVKVWKKGRLCSCAGMRFADGSLVCLELPHICGDVHHAKGRVGALLMDERFWVPLCRRAHSAAHSNPAWAVTVGLLIRGGIDV